MPKLAYEHKRFQAKSLAVIDQANTALAGYAAQGLRLSLRQLYYWFVSHVPGFPNTEHSYDRLGSIINDARMAGLIDWNAIEDRGRWLRSNPHWRSPDRIIASAAESYAIDKWADQDYHVEVWIEKDALIGVIEDVCVSNDVGYFSCRGYTSQSEMWSSAMRLVDKIKQGHQVRILHFGDHDPSGIDMSRDIEQRLLLFICSHLGWARGRENFALERLALNMDQVEQYNPPPNPAKMTDSRAPDYVDQFGHQSWELDALEPSVIVELAQEAINTYRNERKWSEALTREGEGTEQLNLVVANWASVVDVITGDDV
jgi:hypothetical protein